MIDTPFDEIAPTIAVNVDDLLKDNNIRVFVLIVRDDGKYAWSYNQESHHTFFMLLQKIVDRELDEAYELKDKTAKAY